MGVNLYLSIILTSILSLNSSALKDKNDVVKRIKILKQDSSYLGVVYRKLAVHYAGGEEKIFYLVKIPRKSLVSRKIKIRVIESKYGLQKFSDFIKDDVIVQVNGGYFTENGRPLGLIIYKGKVLSRNRLNLRNKGFFIVYKGKPYIRKFLRRKYRAYEVVLESFPLLIYNGKVQIGRSSTIADYRSLIGIDRKGNLIIIVTHRPPFPISEVVKSNRVTYFHIISLLKFLKIRYALSLDGGSSANLYVKDIIKGFDVITALMLVNRIKDVIQVID